MICCLCDKISTVDIVQIILSVIACGLAIYIPAKIKWDQTYSSLMSDYRAYDFASAIQSIVDFFYDTCKCDISKISHEYEKRFKSDFARLQKDEISQSSVLHFQRRILTTFFYQLDLYARSNFFRKRHVQRDFTKNESHILKVLFYMNKAVEENPQIFKDISCTDITPRYTKEKGVNTYILHIYEILKNQPRWIR